MLVLNTLAQSVDLICSMDADGSHAAKDLPYLITALEQGADLVIGSRKIKGGKIVGWDWWRHFCSTSAMIFARLILNLKLKM